MYIAVNRIAAPEGQVQAMIEGFKHAAPGMKRFSGFLGLELWTAEDGTIHAVSRWASKEALDEYLKDDLFRHHHSGAGSEQMNAPNQVSYYSAEVLS
ncbi:MAG TPA: antibiotic biosynthesis monooxygenase family protein [Ktedonobacteraceae bacterium]